MDFKHRGHLLLVQPPPPSPSPQRRPTPALSRQIYLLHLCQCVRERRPGGEEGKEEGKESLIILFAYSRSTVSLRLIFVVVSFTIISTMGIVNFSEIKVTFFGTL